jgi:hypothetical protein
MNDNEIRELSEVELDQTSGGSPSLGPAALAGAKHAARGDDDVGGGSLAVLLLAVGGAVAGVLY